MLACCGVAPQSPELVAPPSASESAFEVTLHVEAPPAMVATGRHAPALELSEATVPAERSGPTESTEPSGPTEATAPTEPAEATEPTASIDPPEWTESTRRTEPSEAKERFDGASVAALAAIDRDEPRASVAHHLGTAEAPRRYGMMFDVGVPDGATLAVVMRPVRAIRIDAGISYNGVSHGVRGGITLVPFATWFTPTVSLDAGHYAEGDANPLARLVTGDPMYSSAALSRVGYDYADAQLGLELGRKRFTFYLRAGATRVTGSLHDLGAVVGDMPKSPVTFGSDPALTVTALSARLGFVLYFGGSR